jgi:hypothetical protein
MRNLKYLLSVALLLGIWSFSYANINPNMHGKNANASNTAATLRMDCAQGTSKVIQSINNVRAMLLNGGDIWWDLTDGQYVVPKVEPGLPEVSSIFAGAVWIGGFTGLPDNPVLKMAAIDYRSGISNDFFPGPLTDVGTVGFDTCANWDKHFKVLGENIALHIKNWELAKAEGRTELDPGEIPADVLGWPAKGNDFFFDVHGFDLPDESTSSQGFGFFYDNYDPSTNIPNEIDVYEPHLGDFPRIDITNCEVETIGQAQYADEMYFWIYNDAGGNHTASQGDPIRMEVQVQSFAWKTNDEINDMTFQRYKLINRAQDPIDSCFFAVWVDPDLGCYTDDYIGSDTTRSLAYVYNEDALDGTTGCQCNGGVATYCDEIPLLGIDYFRGPNAPKVYGVDSVLRNPQNGEPADVLLPLGMSSFIYYNNGGVGNPPPGTTDPNTPAEFYNLISGSWPNGAPLTYGGDGFMSGGEVVKYAFPDAPDDPSGWTMCTENLPFGDRRTLQASGPFTLVSQAVNELIVGVVWVPDVAHACPNIAPLLSADDIAQALFDNCFDITDGPDAPDLDFVELDREIIMILTNGDPLSTNNSGEGYSEIDLQAPPQLPEDVKSYNFEGYRIYQLTEPNVSPAEFNTNPDKARLVTSVDIKNGISKIYNWSPEFNPSDPTDPLWIPTLENEGVLENGISHTFSFKIDQFTSDRIVNHKKYYYTAVAYAYNNYEQFDPSDVVGQRRPYLEGRRNIGDGDAPSYTVIPRPIVYKNLNSGYGDGPIVTRIDGVGVGENNVAISAETEEEILAGTSNGELVYQPGRSPINVKIINPLEVVDGEFQLTFSDINGNNDGNDELDSEMYWQLTNLSDPYAPIYSERTIERLNEQILREYGISIKVGQTDDVGDKADESNGTISYEEIYAETDNWFSYIPDGQTPFNYIRTEEDNDVDPNAVLLDPDEAFSTFGAFTPYILNVFADPPAPAPNTFDYWFTPALRQPAISGVVRGQNKLETLNNVDIVFTSNKDLWSRCVVVETAAPEYYNPATPNSFGLELETEGGARNIELRKGQSVGKDGQPDDSDPSTTGMGYFPGYAIDQETGERLNIFFGENSTYHPGGFAAEEYQANGRDMIWNPTSEIGFNNASNTIPFPFNIIMGGQHYIYVTKEKYDECADLREKLDGGINDIRKGLAQISWTTMPVLNDGSRLNSIEDGLIPTDLRIQLRVDNSYQVVAGTNEFQGYPTYRFKLEGQAATDVVPGETAETALDNINVVPNPYYGYSAYEISQFSNTVKITNLPAKSTVTIYSLDGKFIRQYERDELGVNVTTDRPSSGINTTQVSPALEWDMKNNKGIPVASGVYLIHVDADGLGERVIKWFGVARKFDPSGL